MLAANDNHVAEPAQKLPASTPRRRDDERARPTPHAWREEAILILCRPSTLALLALLALMATGQV